MHLEILAIINCLYFQIVSLDFHYRTLFKLCNGRLFLSHTNRHGCTLDFGNFLNIFQMAARCLLPIIKQHNRLNICKLHVVPKGTPVVFFVIFYKHIVANATLINFDCRTLLKTAYQLQILSAIRHDMFIANSYILIKKSRQGRYVIHLYLKF